MTSPRTLLASRDLHPKKQYGQNFLMDPSTARMIVDRAKLSSDDLVLEIGAGLGALTIPAARQVRRVVAVEKDPQIAGVLETELAAQAVGNVMLLNQDILLLDIQAISAKEGQKFIVLGNLPYNISSQIIIALIHARQSIDRAVLMFQKEVAQRLAVGPGSKDYGRLSVMLQYCADVKKVATVGPHLFLPRPKVASEVIEICFKNFIEEPAADEKLLSAVVKAAFSTRRKTLKNALMNMEVNIDGDTFIRVLDEAGIDPSRRAETLSVSEFVTLSNSFYKAIT
ncbi:MAG: ribosomal RNA small subunit methyltransferase A [Desulfobacteraceae bacterium]|nr:MAG: ribosomal RNA small subunit methyltransferase A [Desulfobacteraceae bacterium]